MKNYLSAVTLFLVFVFAQNSVRAQNYSQLEELYRGKQFFDLRDETEKRAADKSPEILFYRGAVANKFNELQASVSFLQKYLKGSKRNKLRDAYELLADNYVKTHDYARAGETYKLLLDRFGAQMDAEEKRDAETSFNLWSALRNTAPQTIEFAADSRMQAVRDKAKLLNIPVEIGAEKMDFVFDTGANLSTVTASTARRLGLKIIDSNLSIGSSTDKRIASKLAVAPALKIRNMTIKNVVFLVVEDEALFFPQINYQINGIVGFPVIEAFRAVTITKKDEFVVKARPAARKSERNLCFDSLEPLVSASVNNRKMIFFLDTGALTTSFYPAFYKSQEAEIKKNSKPQAVKIGGAGGFKEITAYILENQTINVSGKTAKLDRVQVLTEPVNENSRYYHGVIGQNLIKQFETMTLDFASMSIIFE